MELDKQTSSTYHDTDIQREDSGRETMQMTKPSQRIRPNQPVVR
jgi:hypothetical protein